MISKFIRKNKTKIYMFLIVMVAIIIFYNSKLFNKNLVMKRDGNLSNSKEEEISCDGPTISSTEVDYASASDVKLMLNNTYNGPFNNQKVVFITFDDGPSINTDKILNILNEKDVKATFFVVGRRLNLESNKNRLIEIYRNGHGIGNHSYSHEFSELYKNNKVQVEEFIKELKMTEDIISGLIGPRDRGELLIRMPGGYGSRKYYNDPNLPALNKRFKEENIENIDWNSLNGDAEGKCYTTTQMVNYVKSTAKGKRYVVVLMHDKEGKDKTVEMLPAVIDYFRSEGYVFKKII